MCMFMYVTCYESVYVCVCLCMYERPVRNFFLMTTTTTVMTT